MKILTIAIAAFGILELSNVLMLYFMPGSKKGNGIGVFNAFEKSKSDPELHALVKYLINWVAGTKLIFILLLGVIIAVGSALTKICSAGALILSIATFYWRLYPAIKAMDEKGQITPKGYSRTLGLMIGGFLLMFAAALVLYFAVFR